MKASDETTSSAEPAFKRGSAIYGPALNHASERRATFWIIGIVLLVSTASVAWLGYTVFSATSALTAASNHADSIVKEASEGNLSEIADSSKSLAHEASTAVEHTQGPLWHLAEEFPMIGPNLIAIRQMADIAKSVSEEVIVPLSGSLSSSSPDAASGASASLTSIERLSSQIGPAVKRLQAGVEANQKIALHEANDSVVAGAETLTRSLTDLSAMLTDAEGALKLAPSMLGADGPQTYLVVYQDLSVPTALGGEATLATELTLENGIATVGRQIPSSDFPSRTGSPIVELSPAAVELFGPSVAEEFNESTNRPAWATAGLITQAFWNGYVGGSVDAVMSIDAMAIAHLMQGTGPLTLENGDRIEPADVLALLTQGEPSKEFIAETIKLVLESSLSQNADAGEVIGGLGRGVAEHRIMAWSLDPDRQAKFQESPFNGVAPFNNGVSSTVAVYVRDLSTAPMGTKLKVSAVLDTDACKRNSTLFNTSVTIRSTLTPEESVVLPEGSRSLKAQIFIYGPPTSSLAETTATGASKPDLVGEDLLRPVSRFTVDLSPGESAELNAAFVGTKHTMSPPALRTTPTLTEFGQTVSTAKC